MIIYIYLDICVCFFLCFSIFAGVVCVGDHFGVWVKNGPHVYGWRWFVELEF